MFDVWHGIVTAFKTCSDDGNLENSRNRSINTFLKGSNNKFENKNSIDYLLGQYPNEEI